MIRIRYRALPMKPEQISQVFECWAETGLEAPAVPLGRCRSPALDGARRCLALGMDPDALATTSPDGAVIDCWPPTPLRVFAGLAVTEPDAGQARLRRYVPFQPEVVSHG